MPSGFWQQTKRFLVGDESAGRIDPAKIHLSQVGDEVFNAGAAAATANCGPATVIMAIRLVGASVPGEDRFGGEDLVKHVRLLATGNTNTLTGTNNIELQRVLEKAGLKWKIVRDVTAALRAVTEGTPVILAGNPTAAGCYTERFDYIDLRRWDSGHWILVSRWNHDSRTFTVNDPQSVIGPIEATAKELKAFGNTPEGNFAIQVLR